MQNNKILNMKLNPDEVGFKHGLFGNPYFLSKRSVKKKVFTKKWTMDMAERFTF